MKKYIKTVIFMAIIILILGVILSDPVKAKLEKDVFKDSRDQVPKFKTAENTYDFSEYKIRWNNLDWIQLIRDSKNILEIKINRHISLKRKDTVIDILNTLNCSSEENRVQTFIENEYLEIDYNLFKMIYYSNVNEDEDSDRILLALFN